MEIKRWISLTYVTSFEVRDLRRSNLTTVKKIETSGCFCAKVLRHLFKSGFGVWNSENLGRCGLKSKRWGKWWVKKTDPPLYININAFY